MGGGGSSVFANGSGNLKVVDIVPVGAGVDALFSDGSVYFSPDGMHLGGGGSTVACLRWRSQDCQPDSRGRRRRCLFAGGGASISVRTASIWAAAGRAFNIYNQSTPILQIVPVGAGVVTLLKDGIAYFSPDNRDLGGGGVDGTGGPGVSATITKLVQVGGGVSLNLTTATCT